MTLSRREALCLSSSTLAGLSLRALTPDTLHAQAPQPQETWPDQLVERPLRQGFPAPLPLNPDGSAPEHPSSAAGPITDPLMWRTPNRQAPEIEFDYRKMAIKVDTRGLAKLAEYRVDHRPKGAHEGRGQHTRAVAGYADVDHDRPGRSEFRQCLGVRRWRQDAAPVRPRRCPPRGWNAPDPTDCGQRAATTPGRAEAPTRLAGRWPG